MTAQARMLTRRRRSWQGAAMYIVEGKHERWVDR